MELSKYKSTPPIYSTSRVTLYVYFHYENISQKRNSNSPVFQKVFDVFQSILFDPVVDGALCGVPCGGGGAHLQEQRHHLTHVEDGRQEQRRPTVRPTRAVHVRAVLRKDIKLLEPENSCVYFASCWCSVGALGINFQGRAGRIHQQKQEFHACNACNCVIVRKILFRT